MWPLITMIGHDLTTGSWMSRSFFMALVASSLFSLGLLGGFSIQTIKTKWTHSTAPTIFSGSAFETSTIPSLRSAPNRFKTENISTIRKHESEHSNTATTGGNP